MPPRPCLDCGQPTNRPRCPPCTRTKDRARGSAHARGYDTNHQAARARLTLTLPTLCAYGCGTILTPTAPWVAAHIIDGNPNAGWIAACRSCNERAKRRTPPNG